MEFENEEQKKIYDKCKYIVKLWEHKFKKKNGRLPSKLDIREASSDVKDAYKTYFHLKAKTLERSFCNLDGFKFDDENENIPEPSKINQSESEVIDCITDSTALQQDQPNISLDKLDVGIIESNATTSTSPTNRNDCEKFDIAEENTCTKTEKPKCDNNNIVKKTEKKRNKTYLNNVSIKFSKRNPRKAFVPSGDSGPNKNKNNSTTMDDSSVSNFDGDACAISPSMSDSQSEQDSSIHIENHLQKKTIGLQSVNIVKDLVENKARILRKIDMQWLERISDSTQETSKVFASQSSSNRHNSENDNEESTDSDHIIDDSEDEESPPRKKQKILNGKPLLNITRNISFSKTLQSQEASHTEINKEDSNKNGLGEPFSNLEQMSQQKDKKVDLDKVNEDDEPMTEKEDCHKRTLRSRNVAMSSKNSDQDVIPKTSTSGKRQRAKEILEKKVKSGTLNDNFVRVNLKKKTYSRGKKSINFSKYRTRQWKKKRMEISIEQSSDSLLPIEAYETDTLLTLEEANERAHVKQKRTSKKANKTQENSHDESFGDWNDDCDISDDTLLGIAEREELGIAKDPDEPKLSPSEPLFNDIEHTGTPPEVFQALEEFGYSSFRNGQEIAVNRILEGKSTLVTLSTGSGKSLCYLLPAYLYSQRSHCITLVISPLVSLMDDQVANVPRFIKAASYHTGHTNVQKQKVKDAVAAGKISVLFVSPELLVSGERREDFKSILNILPPIAFACIDEAHCVSQWSHNFRPSYLLVCKILKESLKVNTLLGLTATATKATCDSIRKHFGITDEEGVISDIPLPENLHLTVSKVTKKDEALLKLITSEKFSNYESIIVYCTRRDECEKVAGFLRTYLQSERVSGTNKRKRVSILAECYHAGLSASKRKTVQKAFMSGELKIVVATVAFGMGINKADIRAVIHYNLPRNVESYVQEVGRAGRDRLPAHCHVFFDMEDADKHELRRHAYSNSVDRHIIRKLLRKVFVPCQCTDTCPKHEICFSIQKTVQDLDLQEENIATVLCYLELHQNRYINILSPAYSLCKITYSSVTVLKEAAKKCMPLAKALSLFHNDVKDNIFEFPVVEVASSLFMSSGNCKHKLKNLEWTADGTRSKRSPLNVQYSDLGFRIMAPGNLTKNELDDLLNNIYNQCVQNETNSLLQLEAIHSILLEAENNHSQQSDILRSRIRSYFSSENPLESYSLPEESVDEERIISDVRSLISNFRDVNFTGRAVARIFHGIQSPNFPAYTWGRTKFWRSHVQTNFHTISRIATQEILARH